MDTLEKRKMAICEDELAIELVPILNQQQNSGNTVDDRGWRGGRISSIPLAQNTQQKVLLFVLSIVFAVLVAVIVLGSGKHLSHAVDPAIEPALEHALDLEPAVEPAIEHAVNPAVEPAIKHAVDPAIKHAVDPAVEHAVEPALEHALEPAIEHAVEPAVEPAIEHAVDPAVDPAIEHAVDPAIKPAIRAAVDPAIEPAVEHAVEHAVDPASDVGKQDTMIAAVSSQLCENLREVHGFWNNRQCELWQMIQRGLTTDTSSYLVKNIPKNDRFWRTPVSSANDPRNGRVIYHLHLHKSMGSTFCEWFRVATKRKANSGDNCNIPDKWWWNTSRPDLHYQVGAYIGRTREQEKHVYKQIEKFGWIYVASEGSLSDEPIFGINGPYYHSVVLREPSSWVVSMWHYDTKTMDLDTYLTEELWGVPDFYTRRICGSSCMHNDPLSVEDFLEAKSRLDLFDLVMVMDMVTDVESTELLFRNEFSDLQFPSLDQHMNKRNYKISEFTAFQLDFIQNLTSMDKVLFEYARVLHQQKLNSLNK